MNDPKTKYARASDGQFYAFVPANNGQRVVRRVGDDGKGGVMILPRVRMSKKKKLAMRRAVKAMAAEKVDAEGEE